MRRKRQLPNGDVIRARYHYDEVTGFVRRLVSVAQFKAGSLVGTKHHSGYLHTRVLGCYVSIHCLAYCWMTGEWPTQDLDHKDLNKSNNAWDNIRPASRSQNCGNQTKRRTNRSGFKGVSFKKKNRKWCAQICHQSKVIHLGLFTTPEAAHEAYATAAEFYRGDFARTA